MIRLERICAKCDIQETCEIDKEEFQNEINLVIESLDGEEAYDSIEIYEYILSCIDRIKEKEGCEGNFNSKVKADTKILSVN